MNTPNTNIKRRLIQSKLTIGSWITMRDPIVSEMMAQAGFDWLTVDLEHTAMTLQDVQNHVRIINLCGVTSLVRVGENNANLIKRVMDTGAGGVIVPMVNTKADALKAVASVKYPPKGTRGVGLARAQEYGFGFEQYRRWVNTNSIVVVQIEHIDAVNNLEDILSVKGIDAFIVGPYDLSGSMGIPGQFKHPKVVKALKRVVSVSKKFGVVPGFHVIPPDAKALLAKINAGYRFVAFSLDTLFLGTACRDTLKNVKRRLS